MSLCLHMAQNVDEEILILEIDKLMCYELDQYNSVSYVLHLRKKFNSKFLTICQCYLL